MDDRPDLVLPTVRDKLSLGQQICRLHRHFRLVGHQAVGDQTGKKVDSKIERRAMTGISSASFGRYVTMEILGIVSKCQRTMCKYYLVRPLAGLLSRPI